MKKRLLSLVLSLVMVLSMTAGIAASAAYTPQYTAEAETLYELGLFRGTGTNADGTPIFSLQNKATRLQALIILIRLLGLEAEALATTEPNPFSDIPNNGTGAKYAAYAYSVGLTNGIGGGKFGNGDVTPAQFTTFVLRALGYDDKAGDFKVATAIAKGREIGLLSDDMLTTGGNTLLRDECVKINYNALKTAMKGTDKLLAEKLIDDGVLTKVAVQNSEILGGSVSLPLNASKLSTDEIEKAFPDVAYIGYGSVFRDDSFAQADLSPRMLLLSDKNVQAYCMGETGNMRKHKGTSNIGVDTGIYATIITVLDKDLHLLGYCVSPKVLSDGKLTFKTCYLDASEELAQLKQKAAQIARNTPKFDQSLVWCEAFVTANDNEYTIGGCPAYLEFDVEKLPASMKDFAYYSIYSGGDVMNVSAAWCHKNMNYLVNSKDYSPIIARGQKATVRNVHIEREGIVILYDGNKEPIGYTHLTGDMVRNDNLTQ